MNFDYSHEQKFLKDEARKFLEERCPVTAVRGVLDDGGKPFDRGLWQAVAGMGWTGAVIPEKWGGTGLGHIELCAIAEELGRALAPIPFASTVYVFAEAILAFGSDAQREALLPGIASGAVIGCLATSEREGALSIEGMAANVVGGRLSGAKVPVTDGDVATHAIVAACDEAGPGLFIVDLAGEGIAREAIATLDPTRSVARITFAGSPCERLGAAGEGAALLSAILDRAAVLFAFEQVGGAGRCLEYAKAYAMERYAFGRVIGSYQAIKHKLADIYVRNELARSSAYYGAWALNSGAAELPEAAAAARIAGTQAYDFAARENLQTHGGMGFTWEADCHLHLRRARQLGLALGGLPLWRERLIRTLESRNAL
ncbi:acyl-CoA dehydrogenase family protein [Sphingomonas canadensis]|uniref:Acyl-CoA dehydrogenase family protein n=1 Tax=Sphingomonas canadensis TaxID=1219257 RepID=A0ABW3H2D1_9SPHN|nr:acyl-CoA dehydrogenase family protein [Sphingomonas canadensis]MCW3834464.1 acyl-CoA/acyl-ACP dehydrogenase [Sphingomonas canadensis]